MPFVPPTDLLQGLGAYEILNSLADGAYITDLDRRILFWNHSAERITGWQAAEVVGHRCQDSILVHADKDGRPLCEQELCPLHRSIATGQPSEQPLLLFAKSREGTRVPVEVTVAPICDTSGRVIGGIELFRDLTEAVADLRRARSIQQSCLECLYPADDRLQCEVRYTPSDIVGGDFYRIERAGKDCCAVLVADVLGHGVASALYTVLLRSFWDDHRSKLASPASFLGAINRHLRSLARDAGYFATAVCAHLDLGSGELRCVRAGHPAPLLLRAGGEIVWLAGPQPALGMIEDQGYTDSQYCLLPGDTVLFYTDGALEIRDANDNELGVEGLLRLVREIRGADPAHPLPLARLEAQLLRYSNAIRLPDDLTLLALHRAT